MRRLRKGLDWLVAHTTASLAYTRSIEWRRIIKTMQLSRGLSILSVGCGAGGELYYLSAHNQFSMSVGIDIEISVLKMTASRLPHIEFVAASAEALPFREHMFDRILCSSAIEHFPNDSIALREMAHCLRANGLLLITTDSCKWGQLGKWRDRHAKIALVNRYYSQGLLESSVVDAGLIVTHFENVLTFRWAPSFLRMGVKYQYRGKLYLVLSMIGIIMDCSLGHFFKQRDGFTLLVVAQLPQVTLTQAASSLPLYKAKRGVP